MGGNPSFVHNPLVTNVRAHASQGHHRLPGVPRDPSPDIRVVWLYAVLQHQTPPNPMQGGTLIELTEGRHDNRRGILHARRRTVIHERPPTAMTKIPLFSGVGKS